MERESVTKQRPELRSPVAASATFSRRLSWGAVFAGVVAAMSCQLLLSLLGAGVGAATVSDGGGVNAKLGLGAAIWLVVSGIISLFAGGWVAARLGGIPRRLESVLHGLLTWGFSTLFVVYLLTTAVAGAVSGTAGIIGNVLSGNNAITRQAPQAARNLVQGLAPGNAGAPASGAASVDAAAKSTATGSFGGFLALLLGAIAAGLGGGLGAPKNTILTALPAWDRRGSGALV